MSNVIHTQSKIQMVQLKLWKSDMTVNLYNYRNMPHRRLLKMLCMALDALL